MEAPERPSAFIGVLGHPAELCTLRPDPPDRRHLPGRQRHGSLHQALKACRKSVPHHCCNTAAGKRSSCISDDICDPGKNAGWITEPSNGFGAMQVWLARFVPGGVSFLILQPEPRDAPPF
jgi:hypothetical protein